MKKIFSIVMLMFFVIGLSIACQKNVTKPLTADEVTGERVWQRIIKEENYKKYGAWPNHKGMQRGQSPHGIFHKAFVNSTLLNALPIKDIKAPNGSIIVKENYNSAKELKLITVMAKVEGYYPEEGDWFWGKYTPDGKVLAAGRLKKCAECHKSSFDVDNDFIVLHKIDEK